MSTRRKVLGIEQDVLEMINQSAKETYPDEFLATMRAEKGVITEVILVPGTISNYHSGTMQLHMLPIDLSVVGTVHSHPGPSNLPSEEDLHLFGNFGSTHIITCMPFSMKSWRAYNYRGDVVGLEVV